MMLVGGISKFRGQWRRVARTFKVEILMDIRDLRVVFIQRREGNGRKNLCPTLGVGRGWGGKGGDVRGEERKNLDAPFEFQRRQTDFKRLYEVRSGKIGKSSTQ